jgi:hypothetical protein
LFLLDIKKEEKESYLFVSEHHHLVSLSLKILNFKADERDSNRAGRTIVKLKNKIQNFEIFDGRDDHHDDNDGCTLHYCNSLLRPQHCFPLASSFAGRP